MWTASSSSKCAMTDMHDGWSTRRSIWSSWITLSVLKRLFLRSRLFTATGTPVVRVTAR